MEQRIRLLIEDHKRISELLRVVTEQLHKERSEVRSLKHKLKRSSQDISRLELAAGLQGGRARRKQQQGAANEWIEGAEWLDAQNEEQAEAKLQEARKRAQARVNMLIREIDRCVDLLNAPLGP